MFPADVRQGTDQGQLDVGVVRTVILAHVFLPFVLMTVLLQDGVLDKGFLVIGQDIGVDHVVQSQLADVVEGVGGHVQADGSVEDHAAELKE